MIESQKIDKRQTRASGLTSKSIKSIQNHISRLKSGVSVDDPESKRAFQGRKDSRTNLYNSTLSNKGGFIGQAKKEIITPNSK